MRIILLIRFNDVLHSGKRKRFNRCKRVVYISGNKPRSSRGQVGLHCSSHPWRAIFPAIDSDLVSSINISRYIRPSSIPDTALQTSRNIPLPAITATLRNDGEVSRSIRNGTCLSLTSATSSKRLHMVAARSICYDALGRWRRKCFVTRWQRVAPPTGKQHYVV